MRAATALVALFAATAATAMPLPNYASDDTCRFAERMGPYPYSDCMADEAAAMALLHTHWATISEDIQTRCDLGQRGYNHPGPSFGGLVWCLDRELGTAGRPSPFTSYVAD